jgi:hypothetical protein
MEKSMQHNSTSTLEQPSASKGDENQRIAMSNALLLTAAVCLALTAKNPHPRSPAHAVQHVRRETSSPNEPILHWLQRFLNMSNEDYSIRWDFQRNDWGTDGNQRLNGLTIAEDCVYWMQHQWDFATHEVDDRFDYEDCRSIALHEKAVKEMSNFDFGDFLLPAPGEMVRRVWKSVYAAPLRMLDIWESPSRGKYHYAIREQGSPELLARSSVPFYPHVLKKLVDQELVPSSASKPFVVKLKSHSR